MRWTVDVRARCATLAPRLAWLIGLPAGLFLIGLVLAAPAQAAERHPTGAPTTQSQAVTQSEAVRQPEREPKTGLLPVRGILGTLTPKTGPLGEITPALGHTVRHTVESVTHPLHRTGHPGRADTTPDPGTLDPEPTRGEIGRTTDASRTSAEATGAAATIGTIGTTESPKVRDRKSPAIHRDQSRSNRFCKLSSASHKPAPARHVTVTPTAPSGGHPDGTGTRAGDVSAITTANTGSNVEFSWLPAKPLINGTLPPSGKAAPGHVTPPWNWPDEPSARPG